ncbi:hypothetical protein Bpfe_020568 [Biomphalaria pfeifferi]|uniref:Uncharacterized protein n=1 Tax=Biomphalaria pfeifferi TaxID=112525 RepID=A0AAD8B9D3_BIOPF|nr:hypothetical protein Bpfe_020568 [Biomphalaria pfeifferi]
MSIYFRYASVRNSRFVYFIQASFSYQQHSIPCQLATQLYSAILSSPDKPCHLSPSTIRSFQAIVASPAIMSSVVNLPFPAIRPSPTLL